MLGKFPGYSWHISWTPCEDFPALTEELDERAFLCAAQICCDEGRFLRVRRMDLYFLRVFGGIESLLMQGSSSIWQYVMVCYELSCLEFSLHPERLGDFIEVSVAFI